MLFGFFSPVDMGSFFELLMHIKCFPCTLQNEKSHQNMNVGSHYDNICKDKKQSAEEEELV